MSSIDSPAVPRTRSRRRLAAWLAFGVAGLATGAVWATGFDTIGGTTGSHTAAPIVAPTTPVDHTADLAGKVAAGSALAYNWSGRWGSVAASNLFTVDLSAEASGNAYNIGLLLTNGAALTNSGAGTGWASLQLKVEVVEASGTGGTVCVPADFDGSHATEVMAFDATDAGVYFNGLAGAKTWCVGVAAADGHDIAGTFLRSSTDSAPTVYPSFTATVDRAS
jgi:hypothetical protein